MRRTWPGIDMVVPSLALLLLWSAPPRAAEPPDCPEALVWDGSPGYGAVAPIPLDEALPLVQREAEGLRLVVDGGAVLVRDNPSCGLEGQEGSVADCELHRFVDAFAAPRGYLLHRQFYEGDEHVWVDRAHGTVTSFAHRPRFSPDGRWLLSVSGAEAYNFNGIEIFAITPHRTLQKVWQHAPSGAPEAYAFFTFLRWDGPDAAILCAAPAGDQQVPTPVLLRHGAFGWALQAPR